MINRWKTITYDEFKKGLRAEKLDEAPTEGVAEAPTEAPTEGVERPVLSSTSVRVD
jgi:hypothetical protein